MCFNLAHSGQLLYTYNVVLCIHAINIYTYIIVVYSLFLFENKLDD